MRSLFKSCLRLARCSSGSALVEMTIVVPIAISLLVGGVDFAWKFVTQATGDKSVRGAARYLASLPAGECTGAIPTAEHLAVYGQVSGGSPLVKDWDTRGTINATCGSTVTVTATFPYDSIFLASFLPIAASFTLVTQHKEPQVGGT